MKHIELMNYWIESSDKDFSVVFDLYKSKRFHYALFFGHLSLEKLFKGLYAKLHEKDPCAPRIHDLLSLAKKCGLEVEKDTKIKLDEITTFCFEARYEDYKKEFYKRCTPEYTKKQIEIIKELREWVKSLIEK